MRRECSSKILASWQSVFGGDEAIVGKNVQINQAPFTIIGVMQPEFAELEDAEHPGADTWLPMNITASLLNFRLDQRTGHLFGVSRGSTPASRWLRQKLKPTLSRNAPRNSASALRSAHRRATSSDW